MVPVIEACLSVHVTIKRFVDILNLRCTAAQTSIIPQEGGREAGMDTFSKNLIQITDQELLLKYRSKVRITV